MRFTPTILSCVSRHDTHCTRSMYMNGSSSVSSGRRFVTLLSVVSGGRGRAEQVFVSGG